MANKKKKQRHLTLTDRIYIEQELVRGSSFTDIGNALGKDPSTISKEVRHHYEVTKDTLSTRGCRSCRNYNECTLQHMCGSLVCNKKCRTCGRFRRFRKCDNENFIYCSVPHKPPYVCNGCDSRQTCHFEKHVYHARKAQAEYKEELVNSRVLKDFSYSNKLYDLRKKKKLSQNKLAEDLGISRRTISMIENGEQNVSLDYAYRISAYFNLLVQVVFPETKEEAEHIKTE